MEINLKKTLEALLLSTAEPIGLKEIVKIFARHHQDQLDLSEAQIASTDASTTEGITSNLVTQAQIRAALVSMTDFAEVEDLAYRIIEGPNGYQLVTAPQFAEFVRLLRREPRPMKLSSAALETMAIVAYRQPVTRAEIETIRGVCSDGPLNRLIELELVQVTGRAELPGRPIQYGTTDQFLEFSGIKELDELPASDVLSNREIDDWMRESELPDDAISDQDVGLAKELKTDELPLEATYAEIEWKKENVENDAASSPTDERASPEKT
ncbi:MAG: SMC-Scp complex subunit ScpB [Verrucomicrobiota bacterium]|nr:SMC-Scp complex subunit ScpB [Verrucomicrobiota bacterium]MEC9227578.1 SMC-Scp complex subunit ScpB [Verrucomicrobiota bacterium]